MSSSELRRRWPAVAGLVFLLLLVGLASRPDGLNPVPVGARVGGLIVDTAFYLLLVVLPLGLAGLIWLLHTRPDEAPLQLERQRRHWLLPILSGLALVVILWLRPARLFHLPGFLGAGGAGLLGGATGTVLGGQGGGGFDWPAALIAACVITVSGYLAWRALRTPSVPARRAAEAVYQALSDALELNDDGAGTADPRTAVIRAWITVEAVFRAHGVPRQPSEAPFEYARRAPARTGVSAAPLERLAELYEWARFSTHDVSDDMRVRALTGLRSIREELVSAAV
ncbi:MAG: DUF4129 domain-containing protein [Candidatus Dormibacter sp.]|uniref:DUF4129 domain-containing protein n=1 Tax=Candidatus Dormibacter sp. TaxID=2973982 RepID=UPI000DB43574|nr:MAG: hypothetical protein DLM66_03050 [Candidatus Dormibacteraeota bacterium]